MHSPGRGLLEENERLPQKQRRACQQVYEVIEAEGYQGSAARVWGYIAELRRATPPNGSERGRMSGGASLRPGVLVRWRLRPFADGRVPARPAPELIRQAREGGQGWTGARERVDGNL